MRSSKLFSLPKLPVHSRLAVLAAGAALVACSIAPGAGAAPVKRERLLVAVAGTQSVEWQYATDGWPDPNRTWHKGDGAQTLKFAVAKAIPMNLTVITVPGHRQAVLQPVTPALPAVPATVSRDATWEDHAPVACGGELGDCSTVSGGGQGAAAFDCSERPTSVGLHQLGAPGPHGADDLYLDLSVPTGRLFDNCPPDQRPNGPLSSGFQSAYLDPFELPGALKRLVALRRGRTTTLEANRRSGLTRLLSFKTSCPKLSGIGYQECGTTHVELRVKRVR